MESSRQLKAAAQDEKIYHERRLRYLGTAHVHISSLWVESVAAGPGLIRPQDKGVKELARRFKLEGVRYLADNERHVLALISPQELAEAVQRSNVHLEDLHTSGVPPKLVIPASKPLGVLKGRTRLAAAKRALLNAEKSWWAVDLYSDGLWIWLRFCCCCSQFPESSLELQNHLREDFSNSTSFCDGDILRHIIFYREQSDELNEFKWWARLSKVKTASLRRALEMEEVRDVCNNLLRIPGLWPPFQLGPFQRYRILKCYEVRLSL